jgi:hypothetical protein
MYEQGVPVQAALEVPGVLSLLCLLQELARKVMLNEKSVDEQQAALILYQDVDDARII